MELRGHRHPGSLGRSRSVGTLNTSSSQFVLLGKKFTGIREAAHQLFVNNVLRRVSNSQTQELRKRAARQLFGGNSAPFFALVGVSLASGTGTDHGDQIGCTPLCRFLCAERSGAHKKPSKN